MPNLLTEISHHHLQSSTILACSWQGTCSRTGQPAAHRSTNSSAGCWAPLHVLMADSRGGPSGSETSLLTYRNPRAATTGSPVTTKLCDPNAVLVRSLFKSTIQIRSALPPFIRLTKPIRDACLTVSNACSNAQSWEVFQRVFQSLTGTPQKTNTSTRSMSREPQLFLPVVIWTEQHSEQQCEC